MNLPAAIALALIGMAVVFVIGVKWHARGLVRAEVELARPEYSAGAPVEGQVHITALRRCALQTMRVSLTCSTINAQDARRMSRDGWLYQQAQSWDLDRTLPPGETLILPFALPMPELGALSRSAYLTEGETRYPEI